MPGTNVNCASDAGGGTTSARCFELVRLDVARLTCVGFSAVVSDVLTPMGVDLEQSLYALDSTTIDLCLALFPWARFRRRKAAVKMHTLLDLRGNIPTFIRVTDGKVHDVNMLDEIMPAAGAFYVMDRGYIDFERLFVLTLISAFFLVRTKSNVLLQRRYSHPVDKNTGVRSDQTVILSSF